MLVVTKFSLFRISCNISGIIFQSDIMKKELESKMILEGPVVPL